MNSKNTFKNQISAVLAFGFLAILVCGCKKEILVEKSLNAPSSLALKEKMLLATGITADSYYLVNSLPADYVQDGSVDYTSYVQAAVTEHSNIVFPGFPIMVNNTGITVGSDKTLTFEEGSEIRLQGSDDYATAVFRIADVSNVTLYNPVIIGDRDSHIGTTGEWGMGISILGSSNISVYNAKISKCWGDGIYLGQLNSQINSKNIVIKDAYLYKNRRNGVTIIGVDGLLLENNYAGFTDGTLPMTGINFEANNEFSEFKNARVVNPVTENNGKNGIQVGMGNMMGATDKYVDITVLNHTDIGSPRYPFKIACTPAPGLPGKMYGFVDILNPSWHKTALETNLYLWLGTNNTNFKTTISSPEIMNAAGSILSWTDTYNLIMKAATGGAITVTQAEFAVNAGGDNFKASNGMTYLADKGFSGGTVGKSTRAIAKTVDDVLYQSARYGNFTYSAPLVSGTYSITFKFAETVVTGSRKRQFDIFAENNLLVSNLDIFKLAGGSAAYDVVKTVAVTDGTLNLNFTTDINGAAVCALLVVKK